MEGRYQAVYQGGTLKPRLGTKILITREVRKSVRREIVQTTKYDHTSWYKPYIHFLTKNHKDY